MGKRMIIVQELRSALDRLREKDMTLADNLEAVISAPNGVKAAALRRFLKAVYRIIEISERPALRPKPSDAAWLK